MILRLIVMIAAIVIAVAGCGYGYWHVFVSSQYSEPVIARITYDGGVRDVLIGPYDELVAVKFDMARPPAMIAVLNARTCAVIASGDLPTSSTIVTFGDPYDHSAFGDLGIGPWTDPAPGDPSPVDDRCRDA